MNLLEISALAKWSRHQTFGRSAPCSWISCALIDLPTGLFHSYGHRRAQQCALHQKTSSAALPKLLLESSNTALLNDVIRRQKADWARPLHPRTIVEAIGPLDSWLYQCMAVR